MNGWRASSIINFCSSSPFPELGRGKFIRMLENQINEHKFHTSPLCIYFHHLSVPILFSKATHHSLYSSSVFCSVWFHSKDFKWCRFHSFFLYFIGRVTRIHFIFLNIKSIWKKLRVANRLHFWWQLFVSLGTHTVKMSCPIQ